MQISELARRSGVPARTIRYYESVGLLPAPTRAGNNYRRYELAALERLRFIVSARSLGFALADIGALLAARDAGQAPCERVLDALDAQLASLDRRITDLLALREDLQHLRAEGEQRPRDQGESGQCVCYLVTAYHDGAVVAIERQEIDDG
ncbi:MAG TPA: heavy metal-responsive transcriptional regulator [Chloroflexaceae bacterium]|nr:heavy metal-responsive transcriptional regulator [Chloroflexaceae bacterium]